MKNKKIIFIFMLLSLAVNFTPEKEIFPIFNWGLFARIPKYYIYNTILVTSEECGIKRLPITEFPNKARGIHLLNELWGGISWESPEWRKKVNEEISNKCGNAEASLESVSVIAKTLPLWNRGQWERIKEVYGQYSTSSTSP